MSQNAGPDSVSQAGQVARLLAVVVLLGFLAVFVYVDFIQKDDTGPSPTEIRAASFCHGIEEKSMSFVAASGVTDAGKEWAQQALDSWPSEFEGHCDFTHNFLREMVSGAVDKRLARTAEIPTSGTITSTGVADCESRIATVMSMDIDEQSRRDNVDSIRIECNMPPLQQDPFWQDAWARHQETASP